MSETSYERVLAALESRGSRVVERHHGDAMAQCPSHDDGNPSLHVTAIEGSVLLHCFGPCEREDVQRALGMTGADMFDDKRGADYRYEDGRVEKRRYDRRTGKKKFMQTGAKETSVLYRLSRLREIEPGTEVIHLVEGAKDVLAIEAAGGVATTAPQGAISFHKVDPEPLRGHHVVAVVDNDDGAGMQWAAQVEAKLTGVATSLTFVRAAEGKDAADHIAAGWGLDEFVDLVISAESTDVTDSDHYSPSLDWTDVESGYEGDDTPDNPFEQSPDWPEESPPADKETAKTLVDYLEDHLLTSAGLDGIADPEPLIGEDLLFRDTLNWLVGKPGHGKSFVAIDLAGCVATGEPWQGHEVARGRVLYLVAEGVRGLKKRVRAWERARGLAMDDVDFLPFPVQTTNRTHWDAFVEMVGRRQYAFIVLDTQARITVGIEENSNREMGTFVHQAESLRQAAGSCVLIVHHIGRNGDTGRGATTLDGALSTIMKASKEGAVVTLECQKNKDAEEWPRIEMQLYPEGDSVVLGYNPRISANLQNSVSHTARSTAAKWWDLHEGAWVSGTNLVETLEMTKATVYRHKTELVRFGAAEGREVGRGQQFRLTRNPSEAPDE